MKDYYIENITLRNIILCFREIAEKRFGTLSKDNKRELLFLQKIGFLDNNFNLTEIGLNYYTKKNIQNEKKQAAEIFHTQLINYKPIRFLCELLWGKKDLTKENIYRALLIFEFIKNKIPIEEISGFIMILNQFGILSYSKKMNKIVIKYNPSTEKPDRDEKIISPDTPFTNLIHIREIIRESIDYFYWFDKHFGRKGLEVLIDEIDGSKVSSIKILMSINANENFSKLHRDFKLFQKELENKGISASCRVIIDKDVINRLHGRWIISKTYSYNVSPVNSLFMGQYEILAKQKTKPNFQEWWDKGLDLLQDWNEIIKHISKKT